MYIYIYVAVSENGVYTKSIANWIRKSTTNKFSCLLCSDKPIQDDTEISQNRAQAWLWFVSLFIIPYPELLEQLHIYIYIHTCIYIYIYVKITYGLIKLLQLIWNRRCGPVIIWQKVFFAHTQWGLSICHQCCGKILPWVGVENMWERRSSIFAALSNESIWDLGFLSR